MTIIKTRYGAAKAAPLPNLLRTCGTSPLHLGHDLLGHRTRRFFIAREVHGEGRAALRVRAHVGGVAEHLGQRHHCLNYLRSSAMLDALDAAATAAQVADDGTHVLLGHYHFHRHHRLQQHRAGPARSFLERHRAGDLEGHFVGVNIVIAAVVERGLHVHHFVAGKNAAFHGFLDALVHWLDKFLGDHAAHNFVNKFVALTRLVRFQTNAHVAILAASPGLANVLALRLRLLADGLAIGDLRLADVGLHVELAHHAVHDDFQVQLAHAADDGLSTVGIDIDLKGRGFLG